MESKSHFLAHFIPGILLGSVVGLAFGSLLVASQIPNSTKIISEVTESGECLGRFADLSVKAEGDNEFEIFLKDKLISEEMFPNALYNAGQFYQVNPSSQYAYLDFNPDGLGGYILYPSTYDMIRVNTCTGEVDRLLGSSDGIGQGGSRYGLDISPDEKYLAQFFQDIGPSTSLQIRAIDDVNDVKSYPLPDQKYTQFDAKFSPDGSKIAIIAALGNAMSERGILWIFDMKTRTFGGYKGDGPIHTSFGEAWMMNGWTDNETVDIEANMMN